MNFHENSDVIRSLSKHRRCPKQLERPKQEKVDNGFAHPEQCKSINFYILVGDFFTQRDELNKAEKAKHSKFYIQIKFTIV